MRQCRTHLVVLLTHITGLAKFKQGFSLYQKKRPKLYYILTVTEDFGRRLATENALSTATL